MTTLKLPDTLLHEQADACLAQWVAQLTAHPAQSVDLDASSLHEFDSSALAVLLGLRRVVLTTGGQLHITGLSPRLRELASLYGVLALIEQS